MARDLIMVRFPSYRCSTRAIVRHPNLALHISSDEFDYGYSITHIPTGMRVCPQLYSLLAIRRVYRELCALPGWEKSTNPEMQPGEGVDPALQAAAIEIIKRHGWSDPEMRARGYDSKPETGKL